MSHSPIIPWLGGKRRLSEYILPRLPPHTTYVEPFCGGAAIYFLKAPSKVEVLNDINGDLVNLYRVVQNHLDEFVRYFRWALVSRDEFDRLQRVRSDTLTDIQRAATFYYVRRTAFGARMAAPSFGTKPSGPPTLNLLRIEEELSQAHLRLARTYVECLPWAECLARYDTPETCFYLYPPYLGTEGYGVEFPREEYSAIAAAAGDVDGKMLISINDTPDTRAVFAGLHLTELQAAYTVAAGEQTAARELLLANFEGGDLFA